MSPKEQRLAELATCSVCLELFKEPKMLPCQHTFCLQCVQKFARPPKDASKIKCAQCRAESALPKEGPASLPANICVQSLLDLIGTNFGVDGDQPRCDACETVCDLRCCEHCFRSFCSICEQRHSVELGGQLVAIREQLMATKGRMVKRTKAFADLCDQVKESVHLEIQNRVKRVLEIEGHLVKQVDEATDKGRSLASDIVHQLDTNSEKISRVLQEDFGSSTAKTTTEKVDMFLEIHRECSEWLATADATHLGSLLFSPDSLTISATEPSESEALLQDDDPIPATPGTDIAASSSSPAMGVHHEDVSDNAHSLYYRGRQFLLKARLGSAFLQRPSGVAVSPWSNEVFVVSMDTHRVYVFGMDRKKCLRSFGSRGQR